MLRLRLLAALLTLALAAPSLHAQQRFTPDARIDRLFARWDKPDSPGCAGSVGCVVPASGVMGLIMPGRAGGWISPVSAFTR